MHRIIYNLVYKYAKLLVVVLCVFIGTFGLFYTFFSSLKDNKIVSAENIIEENSIYNSSKEGTLNTFDNLDLDQNLEANNDMFFVKINEQIDLFKAIKNDINVIDIEIVDKKDNRIIDNILYPQKDFSGRIELEYIGKFKDKKSNLALITIEYIDNDVILNEDIFEIYGIGFFNPLDNDVILNDSLIFRINEFDLFDGAVIYFEKGYLNYKNGEFSFISFDGVFGEFSFEYYVGNPDQYQKANVKITIMPSQLIADNYQYTINSNTSLKLDLIKKNSLDVEIDNINSDLVDSFGIFTPIKDFKGVVDFDYTLKDKSGQSATGMIKIEILNKPPIALDDYFDNNNFSFEEVLKNDFDLDGKNIKIYSIADNVLTGQDIDIQMDKGKISIKNNMINLENLKNVSYKIIDQDGEINQANIYLVESL